MCSLEVLSFFSTEPHNPMLLSVLIKFAQTITMHLLSACLEIRKLELDSQSSQTKSIKIVIISFPI